MGMAADTPRQRTEPGSVGDVIETVKAYAEQETVGPIKGAGRWIAMGAAGAVTLGVGAILLVLGVLRLFQTEVSTGRGWSVLWYAIALVVCVVLVLIAKSRIDQTYLDKKDK